MAENLPPVRYRMHKVEERFGNILRKAGNSPEILLKDFSKLDIINNRFTLRVFTLNSQIITFGVFVLLLSYILCADNMFNSSSECIIEMPSDASKIFREPENCDMCIHVSEVDKLANISAILFYEKYAKTARPLVVTDGALNWPALKSFNFDFFQEPI
ncbi:hypothetical protein NQ314_016325 [Rhamnusium bicolor]|uniref:Uncharacterized protein n=1 Tax=Rhamnusium bicolor TaxID=1586634 RepID=A0AAV8WWQ7_9CUCU|nr:hypothetical protein NQ314_016325 [Rhamnusium bicolor]